MRKTISAAVALSISMTAIMLASGPVSADQPPGVYTVKNGDKVDDKTLEGWKTWRALACERCHGSEQEGLVGPSLVNSLKTMSKEDFHTTVINGRPDKGMPPWGASDMMVRNWEGLYAYLKSRSDGAIKPGHLYPIGQ